MQIQIPSQDNKVSQPNKGDFAGNIWASWNMDFISNPGIIKVSPQPNLLYSNLTGTAMIYPVQFVVGTFDTNLRNWLICDGYGIYKSGIGALGFHSSWTKDTTTGTPTDLNHLYSDGVEWNGSLIVSGTDKIHKLTAGTWTDTYQSTQSSTVPHPLGKGFNNLLLIGDYHATDGAIVSSVDTSDSLTVSRVILGKDFNVIWIRSSSNMIYIGCRNVNGGRAKVFAWDGSSENFNYDYKINGSECYAGIVHNEVPYTMNERGELLALTGSAFTQVACLPIFNTGNNLTGSDSTIYNISRNAMTIQDNKIHILIKGSVYYDYNYLENQLSGIWCYDPEVGLHHKYSLTKDTGANIMDYGSPEIVKGGCLMTLDKQIGGILVGVSLYTADGFTDSTIRHCIENFNPDSVHESETIPKIGYFITPKISTQSVQENWQKAWLLIKKFVSADSKIKVKYRTYDKVYATWGQPIVATWSDTNTFVSTPVHTDLTVGDEIEIMSGEGSGLSAHISTLTGTNIIDIDETVAGASGTIRVRASNWIDCGTAINVQELEHFELPLGVNSTWIQFKVVIFATGKEEVRRLILKSEPQLKII